MIAFNYETEFKIENEKGTSEWIERCLALHDREVGEINYIFCDDAYLNKLNVEFLSHDTLTDIISFDYSLGKIISGDIFISEERVVENAKKYLQTPDNEMNRVIIHGVLHFCGLTDKTPEESDLMRQAEERCLSIFKT